MEISETIQTITRLCARNSRESICKPEHRAIVNSRNKNGSLIFNEMSHKSYFSPPLRMC